MRNLIKKLFPSKAKKSFVKQMDIVLEEDYMIPEPEVSCLVHNCQQCKTKEGRRRFAEMSSGRSSSDITKITFNEGEQVSDAQTSIELANSSIND